MNGRRLAGGGRINRDVVLPFTWDGAALSGHAGDTLASALLANGVDLAGRSFKYHRPRGIMSAGVEESGALVTVGEGAHRDPNVRATTLELTAGLSVRSQNAWPSLRRDVGAMSDVFSRFLSAGFYYKTFMGPRVTAARRKYGTAFWMQCEKIIRRAAGMGEASRLPDPDEYEHAHLFCDALVVGGGPAGLSAATAAAREGLDVVLAEQDYELGGDWLNRPASYSAKLAALTAAATDAGVRVMTRTTAFGLYDHGVAGLLQRVTDHLPADDAARKFQPRQRLWTLRSVAVIVAAGALERGFAFGNNDRPGVMLASAARAYLHRYAVLAGARIVVATNNDSAYSTAAELAQAGAEVTLLDARAATGTALHRMAGDAGVATQMGCAPMEVYGRRVRGLRLATADGEAWRPGRRLACDLLLLSGGWSPAIHLHSQRARPVWDAARACFLPGATDEAMVCVGAAAGEWEDDACLRSGAAAGRQVARALGAAQTSLDAEAAPTAAPDGGWQTPIHPLYEVRGISTKLKSFVDMQHDVTADDVRLAKREGFAAPEHLKRYTTLGMATDGGKVGNVIGLGVLAAARGVDIGELGPTGFRPPYTPVSIGALRGRSVGEHFRPLRRTPMHDWNLKRGAVMTMAGLWHRPWYFPRGGDDGGTATADETLDDAYIREAAMVRESVGLCDVTSLGKIAVQGPDAAEFLDRIYVNRFAKLPVGRARYGIMLRDDGLVLDDGTTWRLSETDYLMTTTTAHAGKVMAWLEELLATRWHELRVHVTSVTDQWAGCAVAGPRSRAVLAECVADADAACDARLPFMGVAEAELQGGIPCFIARISFSGELAFEVYVPSDYGAAMMELLWPAARDAGGGLYGLEALGTLRIEKGHVTAAELDGRVSLDDAGLGKMAADKPFIGSALMHRPALLRGDRPRLVGIFPKSREAKFNAGAILCAADAVRGHGEGWVTAVTHSPALGHWIGLGFIAGGHGAWQHRKVVAADPIRGGRCEVETLSPHMFDAKGERLRG